MDFSAADCHSESGTPSQISDDSSDDPNFEIEETQLSLSNLSLKRESKKSKINGVIVKELDYKEEGDELDEMDQNSYELIQKMIEDGKVDRLKVEECKIYLRKHGLRLSGKKDILIQRIKEHIDIVNGDGEAKYPASSFVMNCKGDACKGDVVIFEQNVYEEFSIVSRSAKGGACGTRIVAGRILKESYGAAKQQHTFTIEVLWSKGEKPLPPLHPLLVKGRNLYRLKTMRQKWEDEGERHRILSEKHSRGGAARSNREARVQQKEMRKTQRATRDVRNEHPNRKPEKERREPLHSVYVKPDELINHPQQHPQQQLGAHFPTRAQESNIQFQPVNLHGDPNYRQYAHAALLLHQRQPLMATNYSFHEEHRLNHPRIFPTNPSLSEFPVQRHTFKENPGYSRESRTYHGMQSTNAVGNRPIHQQGYAQKQKCRHFAQGRCYYGERCKFLHESASIN